MIKCHVNEFLPQMNICLNRKLMILLHLYSTSILALVSMLSGRFSYLLFLLLFVVLFGPGKLQLCLFNLQWHHPKDKGGKFIIDIL